MYLRCVYVVFTLCLRCVYVVFTLCLRCVYVVFTLCLRCVYVENHVNFTACHGICFKMQDFFLRFLQINSLHPFVIVNIYI
ncbi:MAG: hypothetical protein ACJAXL_001490 [Alphaproteobacteria bacterium]|jgi:hypothetical protein